MVRLFTYLSFSGLVNSIIAVCIATRVATAFITKAIVSNRYGSDDNSSTDDGSSNKSLKNFISNINSVPYTIFVNEDGKQIGEAISGAKSKAEWNKLINQMLEFTSEK